ncbi:MAG: M1 family metallopeptidase [Acidobacteriia bacterium]|nr:M1 family metallopeptidase [Terriglobia bacterium]
MQLRRVVALTVAAAALSFAAGQPPKLRLAELQHVAPTGYRVNLTLDPEKSDFTGSIDIRVEVKEPLKTVWLNASKIVVREASATAGGKTLKAKSLPGGDDFIGLQFAFAVPAGPAEIHIGYTGTVRQGDSSGIFQAEDGGNHYLLTQFESTDARDAFPCFDEPSYKVPWQLTLVVPSQNQAVSNTPSQSQISVGAVTTYIFKETKPLPSYLVAFAVGPFEFVDAGTAGKNHFPVRIVTPKGRASEARFAAEVTATILTRLEDYFGIPFPYEKSDQVAVPVTLFGAMENAGMVTYVQSSLLAKPETDTISRQRGYVAVAAHELSHQWFGDLVTTEWWNDLWLNEAFATWMEQKLVAEWKPEWKTRIDAVDSKLFAQDQDSLVTARKIRQAIETKGDIANAFDGITYNKGAAVIGMFESWMGPEAFRKGVQSYLQRYAYRTATAGDFLDSLSSAAQKDVTKSFSTFLNQAGVPVVSVALDCRQTAPVLHLEQARFFPLGSKGAAPQVWEIPICVRYGTGSGSQGACTLMTQPKLDWALQEAKSCPAWVYADDRAQGYYRMDYRGGLLTALTNGDGAAGLGAPERVELLGNAQAMTNAGKLPAADALKLAETFHADPERDVVERALNVALSPYPDLVPNGLIANYRRFLLKNFQARAQELGWSHRAGEPDDVRLLRPTLVSAVATTGGDQDLAKQARDLTDKWFQNRGAVDPEVAGAVFRTAAYYGDAALFHRFLAEFKSTQDRQEKSRLLGAMTAFRDRSAIEAGLQALLSKDVALSEAFPLLFAGASEPATRTMPFEFVKAHFDQIMSGHPSIFGNDLGSFLPGVGGAFCDAKSRGELQAFFAPRVDKYTGAPRALAQAIEGIDLCIAIKAAQEPSVAAFLEKY